METTITLFRKWQNLSRIFAVILLISMSDVLPARNFYFVTSGGGAWETLSNWRFDTTTGSVATTLPVAGDAVFLDASIAGGTVTIAAATIAECTILQLNNSTLVNEGTLKVQEYNGTTPGNTVSLGASSLKNYGSLTIKNSSTAVRKLVGLVDYLTTETSSEFVNSGTLTLDNTGSTGMQPVFSFEQATSGTSPKVTLNGTSNKYVLTLKSGSGVTVSGSILFSNAGAACNAIIAGDATINTPLGSYLCVISNATSSFTVAAGSNLTFNGDVIWPKQYITVGGGASFTNDGNLTLTGVGTNGFIQPLNLGNGIFVNNNGASLTINGKITENVLVFGTTNLSSFTNDGTVIFDSSMNGTTHVIYSSAGGGNENFTNTGTLTIKAAPSKAAFLFGNSATYPDVAFINTGTVTVNGLIAAGGTSYNYKNSGTFNFDVSTNNSEAMRNSINFVNSNGSAGIVKGRGKISGLTSSDGILSPGNATNEYGIFEFFTAPEFSISDITLTGTIKMDVKGAGTPGVDYDQIIASHVNSQLDVTGASLELTKSTIHSLANNDIITLFSANKTLTSPLSSVSLPSADWTLDTIDPLKIKVKYTGPNALNDLESDINISVRKNNILLKGSIGQSVSVYTISGILVNNMLINEDISTLIVDKGFYIVSIGSKSYKVLVP